jgi:hypothetical protein
LDFYKKQREDKKRDEKGRFAKKPKANIGTVEYLGDKILGGVTWEKLIEIFATGGYPDISHLHDEVMKYVREKRKNKAVSMDFDF